jgi:hypothetical protein
MMEEIIGLFNGWPVTKGLISHEVTVYLSMPQTRHKEMAFPGSQPIFIKKRMYLSCDCFYVSL